MTLEEYKKQNYTSYYLLGQALGIEGYNPACKAQRWCLTGDPKYWTLPSSRMLVKIEEFTKGKVKIQDMVREHYRKCKEYEQSK